MPRGATVAVMYLWRHYMYYVMSNEQNWRVNTRPDSGWQRDREKQRTLLNVDWVGPRWRRLWWRHRSPRRRRAYVQCCLNEIKYWKMQIHHVDPSTKHPKGPRNRLSLHDGDLAWYWLRFVNLAGLMDLWWNWTGQNYWQRQSWMIARQYFNNYVINWS